MFLKESTAVGGNKSTAYNEGTSLDIVMEAATAWHNLEVRMMRAEHQAIVTENHSLMEEVKETWWARVKQFFIDLWRKIKGFYAHALSAWYNLNNTHGKWLEANSAKLNAKASEGGKIKVRGYKYDQAAIADAIEWSGVVCAAASEKGENADAESNTVEGVKKHIMSEMHLEGTPNEFNSALYVKFRSGKKEAEAMTVSELFSGGVGGAVKVLKSSTSKISAMKASQAKQENMVKAAISLANAGAKSGHDSEGEDDEYAGGGKDSAKAHKGRLTYMKSAISVSQMIGSAAMTAARDSQITAFRALKAVVAGKEEKEGESFTGRRNSDILDRFNY
jgi:hypothetical protein